MIALLSTDDDDLHAQVATWLLARIVNLVHGFCSPRSPRQAEEFEDLRRAMAQWEEFGSVAATALMYRDADAGADIPFPRVLFSEASTGIHSHTYAAETAPSELILRTVISHIMFQTGKILLLEYELSQNPSEAATLCEHIKNHALITCGVIETNNNT